MKMLVCVKQVPASSAGVFVENSEIRTDARGPRPWAMNRFDEFAVEEAVRIKESLPGTTVDVLSVGLASAVETVRRALGMGADIGTLVETAPGRWIPPEATAALIACAARGKDYDLILAGVMSEDEGNGHAGPAAAELLGLPCATFVVSLAVAEDGKSIHVERELGGGIRECLAVELPALIAVQAGINRPRYPSLSNVLRAEKTEIEILPAGSLLPLGFEEWTRLAGAEYPEKKTGALVLEGTREEKAARLFDILKEKHLLAETGAKGPA